MDSRAREINSSLGNCYWKKIAKEVTIFAMEFVNQCKIQRIRDWKIGIVINLPNHETAPIPLPILVKGNNS